jgi:hypothetical protein
MLGDKAEESKGIVRLRGAEDEQEGNEEMLSIAVGEDDRRREQ